MTVQSVEEVCVLVVVIAAASAKVLSWRRDRRRVNTIVDRVRERRQVPPCG